MSNIITLADKTGHLQLTVDTFGSEPVTLGRVDRGQNVLWKGDAAYWGKHDPILFPTIGNCAEARIIVDGRSYPMPKHGFGQRFEWQPVASGNGAPVSVAFPTVPSSLTLELRDNEETRQSFPFPFCVRQTYDIVDEKTVRITWEVSSSVDMPFMMGAHPAFALPDFHAEDEVHGYLQLDTPDIVSQVVLPDGALHDEQTVIQLDEDNLLPLTNSTFACDTLLDIRGLNHQVTLLDKQRQPIVTLCHDMPVIAMWSPKDGCCPFVCIEPWSGVCDKPGYSGEFRDRQFVQHVEAGMTWHTQYSIVVH